MLAAAVGTALSAASACVLGAASVAVGAALVVATFAAILLLWCFGSSAAGLVLPPTLLSCAALVAAVWFLYLF